jgi:hypothetical protein
MQLHVHLRIGQTAAAAEREEGLLELAAGQRRRALLGCKQGFQCSGFPTSCAFQGVLDAAWRDQLQDVRLLQRPLDSSRRGHRAEVDQRPGDGRDRNAAEDGDVARVEVAHAVEIDAAALWPAAAGRDRHVDLRPRRVEDAPSVGGRSVTQHCAGAARKDSTE